MKRIVKNSKEPKSLVEHRLKLAADYDNYPEKDELRQALLSEQGYICCYCMQRINLNKMKIEHYQCQDRYPEKQLDYSNLLGACLGNEGARPQNQHCDTRKGNVDLRINPAHPDKDCEKFIKYRSQGEIASDDTDIDSDLNQVLNLNIYFLVKNRKFALDTVVTQLNKMFPNRTWSSNALQQKLKEYSSRNTEGQYSEYCGFVIAYLKQRLGI